MEETFKKDLEEIKNFLSEKRKLTDLAHRVGVSVRLVHEVFKANSFEELTGDRLTVYQAAIEYVKEIKDLPFKANEVMNNEIK